MKRRALLGLSASALAGLAGCSTLSGGAASECEPISLAAPTPTDEGLSPIEYPDVPSQKSLESVTQFAIEFERAYQHNSFLQGNFIEGTDTVITHTGSPNDAANQINNTYLVGVNGSLATEDNRPETPVSSSETPTPADSLDIEFSAVYAVSEKVVKRKEVDSLSTVSFDRVNTTDWDTLRCLQ